MKDKLKEILPKELEPGMIVTINNSYLCEYVKLEDGYCYFKDVDIEDKQYTDLSSFNGHVIDGIRNVKFSEGSIHGATLRVYSKPLKTIDEINDKIDSLVKQVFSAIHALLRTK